jgi:hypothetical protein
LFGPRKTSESLFTFTMIDCGVRIAGEGERDANCAEALGPKEDANTRPALTQAVKTRFARKILSGLEAMAAFAQIFGMVCWSFASTREGLMQSVEGDAPATNICL